MKPKRHEAEQFDFPFHQQTQNTMSNIALQPVKSSQIAAIGYDPENQRLAIEFINHKAPKEGEEPKNSLYHYDGFTPEQWETFEKADSIGSHFHLHLKGKLKYKRIS